MSEELKPCPKCKSKVTLYTNIERGVFARCEQCKSEFDICGMGDIPLYDGIKIRKSTARKVEKMWNRMVNDEQRKAD